MQFQELIDSVATENFVDAAEWSPAWSEKWVAFADLIGFAAVCDFPNTVTNVVLRYHRCISTAARGVAGVSLSRMTDAVYAIADTPWPLLAFSANLQNECLAHNSYMTRNKSHPLAQYYIAPRITLAHGNTLAPSTLSEDDLSSFPRDGICTDDVLAGTSVVAAYKLEKMSSAFLVTGSREHAERLVEGMTTRGSNDMAQRGVGYWRDELKRPEGERTIFRRPVSASQSVVEIPWVLLRGRQQDLNELWTEDRADVKKKLEELLFIAARMKHQICAQGDALPALKHAASLEQQVYHSLKLMRQQRVFDAATFDALDAEIAKI